MLRTNALVYQGIHVPYYDSGKTGALHHTGAVYTQVLENGLKKIGVFMTNYKVIAKIMGVIILIVGIGEIIPWIYAEVTGDVLAAAAFRICVPVTIGLGFALSFFIRADKKKFGAREGFLLVACCWIVASLIGAFPYLLSDVADNYIDAFFESVTGFTTTGCTTIVGGLTNKSIILWKAISHWLGGMGILIFVISLLPALGVSGQIIAGRKHPVRFCRRPE